MFKLGKAILLAALALGLLRLVHRDVDQVLQAIADALRVDPENRYLGAILSKAELVEDRHLKQLSGLSMIYSTLFLTEGVGLLRQKRWAEYLTVIATGSFIPLELYEVMRAPNALKVVVLAVNAAIFSFLIVVLRRHREA